MRRHVNLEVRNVAKHEGGFRHIPLGALVSLDPSRAAGEVRAALTAHGGNKSRAARSLDVARKTLCRWIESLRTQGYDVEASTSTS